MFATRTSSARDTRSAGGVGRSNAARGVAIVSRVLAPRCPCCRRAHDLLDLGDPSVVDPQSKRHQHRHLLLRLRAWSSGVTIEPSTGSATWNT